MRNDAPSQMEDVGELSPSESASAERFSDAWREEREGWIYMHLSLASRQRMRAAAYGVKDPEWAALTSERHRAMAKALDHVATLRRAGFALPADLAHMLNIENEMEAR